MATYDWQVAKAVLTDSEKDRLVCLYLNRRPDGVIDWNKATAQFESASVNSMRVSHGNSLKKIEKAGGKLEGDGNGSVVVTPKSGKKRVASPGEDDEETSPAPKKSGRKKKAAKEAAVDSSGEDAVKDDAVAVKGEQED